MKIAGFALIGADTLTLVFLLSCACATALSANGSVILAVTETSSEPTEETSITAESSGADARTTDALEQSLQTEVSGQLCWGWASGGTDMPYAYEFFSDHACEESDEGLSWRGDRFDDRVRP
jgi:hypothetical protein